MRPAGPQPPSTIVPFSGPPEYLCVECTKNVRLPTQQPRSIPSSSRCESMVTTGPAVEARTVPCSRSTRAQSSVAICSGKYGPMVRVVNASVAPLELTRKTGTVTGPTCGSPRKPLARPSGRPEASTLTSWRCQAYGSTTVPTSRLCGRSSITGKLWRNGIVCSYASSKVKGLKLEPPELYDPRLSGSGFGGGNGTQIGRASCRERCRYRWSEDQ